MHGFKIDSTLAPLCWCWSLFMRRGVNLLGHFGSWIFKPFLQHRESNVTGAMECKHFVGGAKCVTNASHLDSTHTNPPLLVKMVWRNASFVLFHCHPCFAKHNCEPLLSTLFLLSALLLHCECVFIQCCDFLWDYRFFKTQRCASSEIVPTNILVFFFFFLSFIFYFLFFTKTDVLTFF